MKTCDVLEVRSSDDRGEYCSHVRRAAQTSEKGVIGPPSRDDYSPQQVTS